MVHDVFQFGLAGLAVVSALGAWLSRQRRGSLAWAAVSAGSSALAAHYHVFWATIVFGLMAIWALFCATSILDLAWRAKTGFVLFLALGAAVCIYPTYHDERFGKAEVDPSVTPEARAELETKAKRGQLDVSSWLLENIPFRMVRGLDLKGGLRLVYTVEVDKAIEDKRDRIYDEIRQALASTFGFHTGDKAPTVAELSKLPTVVKVEKSREDAGVVRLTFNDAADSKKIDSEFLKKFISELQVRRSADQKQITLKINSQIESQIRERAVVQAKETVLRRIDSKGLKEANVSVRNEDIIIEMPGSDDRKFAEVRDIISQTARLEFKMVDDDTDYFGPIERSAKVEDLPKGLKWNVENAPVGPGRTKANTFAELVRLPNEDMSSALKRFKEWTSTLQVDPDHEIGFELVNDYDRDKDSYEEVGWRTFYLFSKAEITGDMIREATAHPDPGERSMGGWMVSMDMTPIGGDRFEDITSRNLKRRFAIILDGKVESAPVINSKIPGGHAQITMGSQNPERQRKDANNLMIVLKSGALPAPISPSNEQRIGPSLGNDALTEALKGALTSGALVLVFMVVYYSRAGMIANIAVLFNLILQIAILAMFDASMTLPGIAGLVLTIGIAVDANVLINERIREELRQGKSSRTAVEVGYEKAFSAIIDGHVTTMISAIILMQYGSGPIKGFAVTLLIGVAASLFTGVVCTRLMFDWAVRGRRIKKLYLG